MFYLPSSIFLPLSTTPVAIYGFPSHVDTSLWRERRKGFFIFLLPPILIFKI
jgi:hypothetical protein